MTIAPALATSLGPNVSTRVGATWERYDTAGCFFNYIIYNIKIKLIKYKKHTLTLKKPLFKFLF